jgi:hypothetical protein
LTKLKKVFVPETRLEDDIHPVLGITMVMRNMIKEELSEND